ncbi:MAG: carbohydrate kinase family protein [Candidatus Moranbacteria bacterium]|nr:carbohydrate kinase family protein [Candidatus Moranbacteria bacterium]
MDRIICIGSSTKDVIFPMSDGAVTDTPEDLECQKKISFELGAKYQLAGGRHESIGGCAANVACGLARLGIGTFCCTRMGSDQAGEWIKDGLEKNGVATDLVQMDGNCRSDLSFILAHIPSEDRIIFSDRDANEKLEVLPDEIRKIPAEWFFVSSLNGNEDESWEIKLDKILELVREGGKKMVFNPGQKNIKKNPQKVIEGTKQAQILIVNKDEAIEIVEKSGDFDSDSLNDERFLAEKLNALGAQIVALTDGARGAWGFDGREFLHIAARKEKVADTLGAGDAFSSGFIAAQMNGRSLEDGLRWGIANSSSVVNFYGAIEGLLDEKKILA